MDLQFARISRHDGTGRTDKVAVAIDSRTGRPVVSTRRRAYETNDSWAVRTTGDAVAKAYADGVALRRAALAQKLGL